jgi:hypothetical protein
MNNEQLIVEMAKEIYKLKESEKNLLNVFSYQKKQIEELQIEILELKEAANGN